MPQYMITYLGGDPPTSPDQGKQHFSEFMAWLASLGESAISPANPIKGTVTVSPDGSVSGSGITSMSGFTIVEATSMEAAQAIAKTCPFLKINGSLEVSELMQMPTPE
ncbi:YciI family protein [Amphritea balenae]|uniref:YCII-related domain-containing protein n=1 Tax=Amphritea balenae TaxID=452629 RepID=A0A3P1SM86_9GAMM|nr:YciI family protein [Amphritea balenae]RRC98258.1 hypothetical protein EHS89_14295 [Amphritea balenae]GGK80460.1 hypothetical protein GCM10007941_33510 [Amphritea balenae]